MERFSKNWRSAGLSTAEKAMLVYVEKITLQMQDLSQADVEALRQLGYTDEDIHDIVQIAAYFNYINRIADALGVPPEDFMFTWEREDGNW